MPDSGDAEDWVSSKTNVGGKTTRLAGKFSKPVKPIVIYGEKRKYRIEKMIDIYVYIFIFFLCE